MLGKIVLYKLTSYDVSSINKRRADYGKADKTLETGFQAHSGNNVNEGEIYPMVVTKVWSGSLVNGQVLLDGNDVLWATSRKEGTEVGEYQLMETK